MASPASATAAKLGGTERACILRIGIRLTTSIEQAATQAQTNHGDVHQPTPNWSLAASGPSAEMAPAGAGTPTKNSRANEGWLASQRREVEPARPNTLETP